MKIIYSNKNLLFKKIKTLRLKKKTIGLCHGCFDILHWGHLLHFKSAKKKCDFLIVSVTSKKYVNKGPGRPIFNNKQRLFTLSEIKSIDALIINNKKNSLNLIKKIKPNFYFKGKEYKPINQKINNNFFLEKKCVNQNFGKVIFTNDRIYSTSKIIKKILQL